MKNIFSNIRQKIYNKSARRCIALLIYLAITSPSFSQKVTNPFLGGEDTPKASTDHNKPVSRGYIIPSATETPNGAKLAVEIFHNLKNDVVSLHLQVVLNDG